jgi:hypothetical protein
MDHMEVKRAKEGAWTSSIQSLAGQKCNGT